MLGLFSRWRPTTQFVYALAHDLHCDPWRAYDYNRWFHGPSYGLGLWTTDVIAIQHERQRELLPRLLRGRAILIPNLMRSYAPTVRPYEQATFDGIWVAKIRPEKRLGTFLDLVAALPELRFAVVGGFDPEMGADERGQLERRMSELPNLSVLGPQRAAQVAALLAQSKLLVNTSSAEGFPNTMLEAWSLGVPVASLAVDPGGVISRERLGLLSGSAPQLCQDVLALARTPQLNQAFGERGLAYVSRQHSLAEVCRAFERALPGARLLAAQQSRGVA